MRDRRVALKKLADARAEFIDWLDKNDVSYRQSITPRFGTVIEIGYLWILVEYRPLSFSHYEAKTFHYRGPYVPVFVSRYDHWHYLEYDRHGLTPYRHGEYRALVPDFVVRNEWQEPRRWRWHPAVELNDLALLDLLKLQMRVSPWPRNSRGYLMVPKVTGCSGKVLVEPESIEIEHTWNEPTWQPVAGDAFQWTVCRSKTRSTTENTSASNNLSPTAD